MSSVYIRSSEGILNKAWSHNSSPSIQLYNNSINAYMLQLTQCQNKQASIEHVLKQLEQHIAETEGKLKEATTFREENTALIITPQLDALKELRQRLESQVLLFFK
jgi:septal ring factor EnvC (AmiA/AmiB activator)